MMLRVRFLYSKKGENNTMSQIEIYINIFLVIFLLIGFIGTKVLKEKKKHDPSYQKKQREVSLEKKRREMEDRELDDITSSYDYSDEDY